MEDPQDEATIEHTTPLYQKIIFPLLGMKALRDLSNHASDTNIETQSSTGSYRQTLSLLTGWSLLL